MVLDVLVAISAFFTVTLVAVWALRGVGGPVEARVRALGLGQSPDQRRQGEDLPFQARVVAPLIESVGSRVGALFPGAFVNRTEKRLILAGSPMSVSAFYSLMVGAGALLAATFLFLMFVVSDGPPNILLVLLSLLMGFVGMYAMVFWLSAQATGRRTQMLLGLPDTMDLLTICVEAGLGLDAAFQRVTQKQTGPLVDEISQMLREIGLGKPRRQALLDLADRTDLEDVKNFANAVTQAEQLGTSLGRVLRTQSERLRVKRRQAAEQEARRAPVKMVFPLVFCLMPSLFIFILGPIVVNLVEYLSGR